VIVTASLITLFLASCIRADWLDGDIGVDRPNGDLPNMPIPFEAKQTAADCAKICMNKTDCLAWAYCTPNCGRDKQPSCYLKGNVTTQTPNPCRVRPLSRMTSAHRGAHIELLYCNSYRFLGSRSTHLYLLNLFHSLYLPSSHLVSIQFKNQISYLLIHLGWLKQQLQVQAAGLSGHLPLFWADVENSSWVGGTADGGLHERTPYWLNGFVPLAFQLEDPDLISMVTLFCIWQFVS